MQRDSIANTLIVAIGVCLVCSLLVASAAVGLRPLQEANVAVDKKRNILSAAGFSAEETRSDAQVNELFAERVEPIIIELSTGDEAAEKFVELVEEADPNTEITSVNLALKNYDQIATSKDSKALRDERLARKITERKKDLAGIKSVERFSSVYLVKNESGQVEKYVFPIRGKGLWSILKGFIAVENDFDTVAGLTYYEHGETPGLGAEVDAKWWKDLWRDSSAPKKLYDKQGQVAIKVIKGAADKDDVFSVDGLSGATITSRGVTDMLRFWMGPEGFRPFIDQKRGDVQVGMNTDQAATNGGAN